MRHVNRGFDHVGVSVCAFIESMCRVDLDVHNVITFRHARNVNPLTAELFEIPIRPAGRDALGGTVVTTALVVVRVFKQVFETERLFMSLRGDRAIHVEQLIIGKPLDVVMIVTR